MKNILGKQKNLFSSQITKTYQFRIESLKKLKKMIIDNEEVINDALYKDLGKSREESFMTEIGIVLSELNFYIKNLKKFMKIKKVKTPITLWPAKSYKYYEPLGNVLIIAPWNYPFQLAINPLVGAIAAGNTAVIKPSEISVHTEQVILKLIKETFDESYVTVVTGGVEVTQGLLELKFDHIFFTGSPNVGKIVMEKASKHLTSVTLELGGKSPVFVDKDYDLNLAAKRIAFGKVINAGQTCIAPDYAMIHKSNLNEFVNCYAETINEFFGSNILKNNQYPKIITNKHFDRLTNMITSQKILLGGKRGNNKIEPTLVHVKDLNSSLMQEEIFGPILPIITYDNKEEAINLVLSYEKPLAAYVFTDDKNYKKRWEERVSSGGLVFNDTIVHFMNHHLGFGGVGNSGIGKYHGYESFLTFSHEKSVVNRSKIDLKVRYQPLDEKKMKLLRKIIK